MTGFNPQGLHAEDIGNDPNEMTPNGLAEGDDPKMMLPTVAAPPAYTDPGNPDAASGSVNLPLDNHPLDISEDYGASAADAGAVSAAPSTLNLNDGSTNESSAVTDVEDWTVADYKEHLKAADLSTSGNKEELADRWQEHVESQSHVNDDNSVPEGDGTSTES